MSARLISLTLLVAYLGLFLLVAVLVALGAFPGMHVDFFHTPQMINHTGYAALLI